MTRINLAKEELRHGDCLELLKEIPDGSIDMILNDPPYGTTNCKWDSVIPLSEMWASVERVIKPNGCIAIFGQNPFSSSLISSNYKLYRYDWVYEKTEANGHLNAKRSPLRAHEYIHIFYKKLPTYNPQKTFGHVRKTSKNKGVDQSSLYGKQNSPSCYDSTERFPRSVLRFSKDKQTQNYHPTQKPVALLEYLIKTYTNEDETVLDFTMGSGSTGIACRNTGRNFVGIEKDEVYFETAKQRMAQ